MDTFIEWATIKRECEVYKFIRKHAGKILTRKFIEKELNYDINILDKDFKSAIKKYIINRASHQKEAFIMDMFMVSRENLDYIPIPDDSVLPFIKVIFVDVSENHFVVAKNIIPFWMLEEYGGFIPEIPRIFQHAGVA